MNILSVNWGLFAERLLPIVLRTPFWIAWCRVLLKPLTTLNQIFHAQVVYSGYLLNFTSQTALFEWHLNNFFGVSNITIINHTHYGDAAIVYDAVLNIEVPVVYDGAGGYDAMIVYDVQPTLGFNFTVNTPISLQPRQTELRQMIERYKHASFTYTLNWF